MRTVQLFIFEKDSFVLAALLEALEAAEEKEGATVLKLKDSEIRISVDRLLDVASVPLQHFYPLPRYLRGSWKVDDFLQPDRTLWGLVETQGTLLPVLDLRALAEDN